MKDNDWIDGTPNSAEHFGVSVCVENNHGDRYFGVYLGGDDENFVIDETPFCRAGFKKFRIDQGK